MLNCEQLHPEFDRQVIKKEKLYFFHVIWKQFSGKIYFLIKIFLVCFALYHQLKCKGVTTLLAKYLNNILYDKIFFSFLFSLHIYCELIYPESVS